MLDSSCTAHRPNTTKYKNYILVLAEECKPEILPEHWGSGRADPLWEQGRETDRKSLPKTLPGVLLEWKREERRSRRKTEDAVLILEADETDRG